MLVGEYRDAAAPVVDRSWTVGGQISARVGALDVESFTDAELSLIRRAVREYQSVRNNQGLPRTAKDINRWHAPEERENTEVPLHLKTLQRFMRGDWIEPVSAKLIKDFMDAKAPIDNIETVADAAVALFGALTPGTGSGTEPITDRLFNSFTSTYDVYLYGKAQTRNPDLTVKKTAKGFSYFEGGDYYVPSTSDEEFAANPYRILHSRIELTRVPYADWLQVREEIWNPRMLPHDNAWQSSEKARGILTIGDEERLFIMILRGDQTRGARIYMLQQHSEDYGKPPEQTRYFGGIVTRVDEGFPTAAAAGNVQLVPVGV